MIDNEHVAMDLSGNQAISTTGTQPIIELKQMCVAQQEKHVLKQIRPWDVINNTRPTWTETNHFRCSIIRYRWQGDERISPNNTSMLNE